MLLRQLSSGAGLLPGPSCTGMDFALHGPDEYMQVAHLPACRCMACAGVCCQPASCISLWLVVSLAAQCCALLHHAHSCLPARCCNQTVDGSMKGGTCMQATNCTSHLCATVWVWVVWFLPVRCLGGITLLMCRVCVELRQPVSVAIILL